MQNCFREYPEVYGSELEGDDEDNEDDMPADAAPAPASAETASPRIKSHPETSAVDQGKLFSEPSSKPAPGPETSTTAGEQPSWQPQSAEKVADGRPALSLVPNGYKPDDAKNNEPVSESESLVPKAAHDAVERK
jgi:intermembrane space import and assembly protein 40